MDVAVSILAIVTYLWNYVDSAIPPAACFANFRWDDCGYPPQAVLYYYKPGSRCEVGFWRGCLPNPNMFKDEYECVNTCIFTVRAHPEDYHNLNDDLDNLIENGTQSDVTTPADYDSSTTDVTGTDGGATGATGGATGDDGADGAPDKASTPAGGEAPAGGETSAGGTTVGGEPTTTSEPGN